MSSDTKHILVVDDQSNWRKALRLLLENEGLKVSESDNALTAKEMIEATAFDLAILDVRLIDSEMLNVEGLDLLDFIKKNSPATKTIVITGYPRVLQNAKPDDADDFILKVPGKSSFDIKGFREMVKRLLNV